MAQIYQEVMPYASIEKCGMVVHSMKKQEIKCSQLVTRWKKNHGFSRTEFEKKSVRSWSKGLAGKNHTDLVRRLEKSDCMIIGDYRINTKQIIQWINLVDPYITPKWKFITDRFDRKQFQMIEMYLDGVIALPALIEAFEFSKPLHHCPEGGMVLVLQWLKKKKIKPELINASGSYENQTKRFYKAIQRSEFKNVVAWTGSLKVAPKWTEKFIHLPETAVCINVDSEALYQKYKKPWAHKKNHWIYTRNNPLLNLECIRLWKEHQPYFVYPEELSNFTQETLYLFQKTMKVKEKKIPFKIIHPYLSSSTHKPSKMDDATFKFVKKRFDRMESVVIPSHNLIAITCLDRASIAEEVMHLLRTHNSSKKTFGPWVTIWEEAWGMFGSLLVDPQREIENKESKEVWESVHLMGYALGKSMFELWKENKKRSVIREAFSWFTESEREAEKFVEKMQILLWA